jgi:hypothetical protein
MVMGMSDQRTVHVEQSDPAESAMGDAQGRRHQFLPPGIAPQNGCLVGAAL